MLPSPKVVAISWASGAVAGAAYATWAITTQNLPRHTQIILVSAVAAQTVLTGVTFLILSKKQAGEQVAKKKPEARF